MIDTIRVAETPEGVALEMTCASFYVRGVAWLIDAFIQGVIIIILAIALPRFGNLGMGLFFIALFLLQWLYPVFFEMFMNGQTPGKKAMKIQVLLVDGTMINWGASLLRNLLRTVDFLPFFYAIGVMTMMLSQDFRRLGDLAANTLVVYKRQLKENQAVSATGSYVPKLSLTAREQQAIVGYAERLQDFSPDRAEELALLAKPLLNDLNRQQKQAYPATQRLLSTANHILGRR